MAQEAQYRGWTVYAKREGVRGEWIGVALKEPVAGYGSGGGGFESTRRFRGRGAKAQALAAIKAELDRKPGA